MRARTIESRSLEAAPRMETRTVGADPQASVGWWLTPSLFREQGECCRVVEVHSPGGDAFEITLRCGG